MLFNILITGTVNFVFTLLAIRFVDNWGRRRMMLFGAFGLTIIYSFLGLSYFLGWTGIPIVILVVAAIATYAMTLAPVTWVILSEIFPNQWLAANFIAMIVYYRLFTRLKTAKLLNNFSPKDIIETSKSIYKMKILGNWHLSEITVKTKDLLKKIEIDNLK